MTNKSKKMFYEINATSIERYLLLNGWTRDYQFQNSYLMSFIYEPLERRIAIPANESYDDFYITLESALQTISVIQHQDIEQIIKDISNVYFDKMEFRIISKSSEDGKLPLDYAAKCIEGLKELILYSACAETDAKPICSRTTNIAKGYLKNFKLAQTEVGSFVVNIDIKVIDERNEQFVLETIEPPSPFEHKIVKRIYNAINQIDDAICHQQHLSEIAQSAYETGITANMCDALLKIKPENWDAEIDTTLRYASALPTSEEKTKHVLINNHHFCAMDELAKIYRDKMIYDDVVLRGFVKSLAKKDVEDITERTIKLLAKYDDVYRTIYMDLSDTDHLTACDAYRDDLEVEVAGELDMSKRIWYLSKIRHFKIV